MLIKQIQLMNWDFYMLIAKIYENSLYHAFFKLIQRKND